MSSPNLVARVPKPEDAIPLTEEKLSEAMAPPPGSPKQKLTIPDEQILENVRTNIRRHLPQLRIWPTNRAEVVIAAGGPSLHLSFDELRDLHFEKRPIFALNGAANFLVEHNIRPSAFVCMDGMPQNVEFVREPIVGCKYFLASQCDPSLFDACEGRDVTIFHVNSTGQGDKEEGPEKDMLDKHYHGRWETVVGGYSVGTRAIWLCRMLGYELIHIFGLDSCYMDGEHHAYSQAWDDGKKVWDIWYAGRQFKCAASHISQVQAFKKVADKLGGAFHLQVHGDGLIAHMVRSGGNFELENRSLAKGE